MQEPKRFRVTVAVNVTEHTPDGEVPFFDGSNVYHDMGYASVVSLERLLVEFQKRANDLGIETVKAQGLGDKLAAVRKVLGEEL